MFRAKAALQRELDARKQSAAGGRIREFQKADRRLLEVYNRALEMGGGRITPEEKAMVAEANRREKPKIMEMIEGERDATTLMLTAEPAPLCEVLGDQGAHIRKAEGHYGLMVMEFESICEAESYAAFTGELLWEYFRAYKEHARLKSFLARDLFHAAACNMMLGVNGPEDVLEFFERTNDEHDWGSIPGGYEGLTAARSMRLGEIAMLFVDEAYPEEADEINAKIAGGLA